MSHSFAALYRQLRPAQRLKPVRRQLCGQLAMDRVGKHAVTLRSWTLQPRNLACRRSLTQLFFSGKCGEGVCSRWAGHRQARCFRGGLVNFLLPNFHETFCGQITAIRKSIRARGAGFEALLALCNMSPGILRRSHELAQYLAYFLQLRTTQR